MTYLPLAKRWRDVKAKLGDVTEEKILANTKIGDVDPTPVDNVLLKVIDGLLQLRTSADDNFRFLQSSSLYPTVALKEMQNMQAYPLLVHDITTGDLVESVASPILEPAAASEWDSRGGGWHRCFYDRDLKLYILMYCGISAETGTAQIGLATSEDGEVFTKHPDNPFITPGAVSEPDSMHCTEVDVLKYQDEYRIYYTSSARTTFWDTISLCTATDILDKTTYTKYVGNPILSSGAASAWDDDRIGQPRVFFYEGRWIMLYTGFDGLNARIGAAFSLNGRDWTKSAANPLIGLGAASAFDEGGVSTPVQVPMISMGKGILVFYCGHNAVRGGGIAVLPDGIDAVCEKHPDNPIIVVGAASSYNATCNRAANIFIDANVKRWRIETQAKDVAGAAGKFYVGLYFIDIKRVMGV